MGTKSHIVGKAMSRWTIGAALWAMLGMTLSIGLIAADQPTAYDLFLKEMGGTIPFPPQKIVEILASRKIPVTAAIFPNGRSLERGVTSYEKPRSLLAFDLAPPSQSGDETRHQMVFLAYTPGNEGLQIISQNQNHPNAPFDFKLVTSYARGKTPEMNEPSSRGLCTSCHQNGGPIFTEFPWNETQSNSEITHRMLNESNLDPFANYLLQRGTPVRLNSQDYEKLVRNAADRLPHGSCRGFCGDSELCKRKMTMGALISNGVQFSKEPLEEYQLNDADFKAAMERDKGDPRQIAGSLRGGLLLDRNPIGQEQKISSGPFNDPLVRRPLLLRPLSGNYDAVNKRLLHLRIYESCFPFSMSEINLLQSFSANDWKTTFASPEFESLLKTNFPPSNSELIAALQAARLKTSHQKKDVADSSDCNKDKQISILGQNDSNIKDANQAATLVSESDPPVPHKSTSELFIRYCASCHYGAESAAPTLPLLDMKAMKNYQGAIRGRTVEKLLSAPEFLMPPENAPQPSKTDRDEMIREMREITR